MAGMWRSRGLAECFVYLARSPQWHYEALPRTIARGGGKVSREIRWLGRLVMLRTVALTGSDPPMKSYRTNGHSA